MIVRGDLVVIVVLGEKPLTNRSASDEETVRLSRPDSPHRVGIHTPRTGLLEKVEERAE